MVCCTNYGPQKSYKRPALLLSKQKNEYNVAQNYIYCIIKNAYNQSFIVCKMFLTSVIWKRLGITAFTLFHLSKSEVATDFLLQRNLSLSQVHVNDEHFGTSAPILNYLAEQVIISTTFLRAAFLLKLLCTVFQSKIVPVWISNVDPGEI